MKTLHDLKKIRAASPTPVFVLFPLGSKRFALPAETVTELARPGEMESFPHTTPLVSGILMRRGRIVPVCDVAPVLIGSESPARRSYLIVNRHFDGGASEWTALLVSGECELRAAPMLPPTGRLPHYVNGLLLIDGQFVEVLDLETLLSMEVPV